MWVSYWFCEFPASWCLSVPAGARSGLLPLDGARRLAGDVVDYAREARDLVHDAARQIPVDIIQVGYLPSAR